MATRNEKRGLRIKITNGQNNDEKLEWSAHACRARAMDFSDRKWDLGRCACGEPAVVGCGMRSWVFVTGWMEMALTG